MSYLFGDSTPSPFQINFIDFLRLAMEFSAHVLRVEDRVIAERARRIELEQETDTDRQRLDRMLARLVEAIREASADAQPRVANIAENIHRKAQEAVESGLQALALNLRQDLAEIEQNIRQERRSCLKALEKVLLSYDLPQGEDTIHVHLSEGGRYSAWLESVTPYGLETMLELAIPPESAFAHDARVDRFIDGLEIHAPETAGWLRKESKMIPQKLGRFYIAELAIDEVESLIKLRSAPEEHASGYDIVVRAEEPRVRLVKTGPDVDGAGPFDPEPSDVPNVLRFRDMLEETSRALVKPRALTSARIGGQPLEESEGLRVFVEQLIQVLAPMVREISAHSLSPGELVLRRMKADHRREEIFVSKSELLAPLDGLGDDDRKLFDPLELDVARPEGKNAAASRVSELLEDELEIERAGASRARANHSNRPPAAADSAGDPRD
jgi:hypothetical protein